MQTKIYLLLYIGALVVISLQKSYEPLIFVFVALFLMSGKSAFVFARRALLLVAFFSFFITLSYSLMLYIQDQPFWNYFLTLNLRSLDMMYLTLLFTAKVNIYEAVAFSKELSFLLVLSVSKIMTMQRVFADYSDALRSRRLKKPSIGQIYEYLGSSIAGFLDRSIQESKENFEAMRSRGFHV